MLETAPTATESASPPLDAAISRLAARQYEVISSLALCRRAGLPQPRVNDDVEGLEVDFVFRDHRVLVETDSWRHHKSRESFESDRRRDATHAAGYQTLRFTHRQLTQEPAAVRRALEAVLQRGASAASSVA